MEKLRAYQNTAIVTAIFVVVYFGLIIAGLESLLLWGAFTIAWIAAEWRFANDSPLKTWHWAVIIVGIVLLGMAVDVAIT